MLKKLAVALTACAFMFVGYAPTASACPGMDDTSKVAKKDKKQDDKKQAKKKKTKKKKDTKPSKVG